jgi:prephenate dehydratase
MARIAYFGPAGTFTELAARQLTAGRADVELVPSPTIPAAVDEVRSGKVEAAVVPVENSVEGSVAATLDSLGRPDPVVVVAETMLPIRFSVLVASGTTARDVRTVATHPHAAAQVRDWLATHLPDAEVIPSASTSAAADLVALGRADAAVVSPAAQERSTLEVLARDVADVADAVTRFLLVSAPVPPPPRTGADRTSILAVTAHRPGALVGLLTEFSVRGIDLTRIESRPMPGRLGEYRFFLEVEGHVAEARIGEALMALRRGCVEVRFLGSYPRADRVTGEPSGDETFIEALAWLADIRVGGRG